MHMTEHMLGDRCFERRATGRLVCKFGNLFPLDRPPLTCQQAMIFFASCPLDRRHPRASKRTHSHVSASRKQIWFAPQLPWLMRTEVHTNGKGRSRNQIKWMSNQTKVETQRRSGRPKVELDSNNYMHMCANTKSTIPPHTWTRGALPMMFLVMMFLDDARSLLSTPLTSALWIGMGRKCTCGKIVYVNKRAFHSVDNMGKLTVWSETALWGV